MAAGGLLTATLAYNVLLEDFWPGGLALVLLHSVVMLAICLLACIVPTRRALGLEPTEALKDA